MRAAARDRHARWFFYTCFAFVAGGKVANASAKLSREWNGGMALGTQHNLGRLFRKCGAVLIASLRFGRRLAIFFINFSRSLYSGTMRRFTASWRRCRFIVGRMRSPPTGDSKEVDA
jgi:hypothetical protein